MTMHHRPCATVQFRREVEAGLRAPNDPTDALWEAMWRETAARCWHVAGKPDEAAALLQEGARIIVQAAQQKRDGNAK